MRKFALMVAVLAVVMTPVWVIAQEAGQGASSVSKPPEHFYKLTLVVEEVNDAGKVTNARSYLATICTAINHPQQIRTGAKIPVGNATQFEYMNMGVDFDVADVKESGDKLGFNLTADVSSLANSSGAASTELLAHPVIRQNRWSSTVLVPIGKPTVVFSADDLEDKGKMQVEVTAVRVD
jgi:hypothetical protein